MHSYFYEDAEAAAKEPQCYLDNGYGIEVDWAKAVDQDPDGSISKMALIVKTKADGTIKRRIIVDLRRSGANSKSICPERIAAQAGRRRGRRAGPGRERA